MDAAPSSGDHEMQCNGEARWPSEPVVTTTTIDYTYDTPPRLIAADYDSGEFFHYTYDAVGNRVSQETHAGTSVYTYDPADRLIEVGGVAYTWSATGSLLSDGVHTYAHNHANLLQR
jgi:YD repeat-containing protein